MRTSVQFDRDLAAKLDSPILLGIGESGSTALAGPSVFTAVALDLESPGKLATPIFKRAHRSSHERERKVSLAVRRNALWGVLLIYPADSVYHYSPQQLVRYTVPTLVAAARQTLGPDFRLVLSDHRDKRSYGEVASLYVNNGSTLSATKASASRMASWHQRLYMRRMHPFHPVYGWRTNRGFSTEYHQYALDIEGPSPQHRWSAQPRRMRGPAPWSTGYRPPELLVPETVHVFGKSFGKLIPVDPAQFHGRHLEPLG